MVTMTVFLQFTSVTLQITQKSKSWCTANYTDCMENLYPHSMMLQLWGFFRQSKKDFLMLVLNLCRVILSSSVVSREVKHIRKVLGINTSHGILWLRLHLNLLFLHSSILLQIPMQDLLWEAKIWWHVQSTQKGTLFNKSFLCFALLKTPTFCNLSFCRF